MSRILITSGPTREYLDPVRFLSNDSSGKMGAALAKAAIKGGFDVTIISGPVSCDYPQKAKIVLVTTTEEMLHACLREFPRCVGAIGAAAPCDYRVKQTAPEKIKKNGKDSFTIELVETPDILAELGRVKRPDQWLVPFALETSEQGRQFALGKLRDKNGNLIILNGPNAMLGDQTQVELLDRTGELIASFSGTKENVAVQIFNIIAQTVMQSH